MRIQRRVGLGVLLIGLLVAIAGVARGQVLQQVPADAKLVLKFNNPEMISAKIAALAQKLGIAQMVPPLQDPLAMLKQQWNLKDGIDTKGEVAVVLLSPEGQSDRFMILAPVSDYEAFLKNLSNAKTEGELTTFNLAGDEDPIYAAHWGSYAAISPWKSAVSQKPTGIEVAGAAAQQLQNNDAVLFVNIKALAPPLLSQFDAIRSQAMQSTEADVPANLQPVAKAAMTQLLALAENFLKEGQAVTVGLTLSEKGINLTALGQVDPAGSLGQAIASMKTGDDAAMLAALPPGKYMVYGGAVLDQAAVTKILEDALGPVEKALEGVEEGKPVAAVMGAVKTVLSSTSSLSGGWLASDGQGPAMGQQVMIFNGDAKKIQEGMRTLYQMAVATAAQQPAGQGPAVQAEYKPDAATVAGASLDLMTMQVKPDPAQGPQAAMVAGMLFGPEGSRTLMGPISDQTYISVSGSEELAGTVAAAAKTPQNTLGQQAHVQAVAEQLPKGRMAVLYIAVDNMISHGVQVAQQMGMQVQMRLPPDLPPIGLSLATEGAAMRADLHLSADLIQQLMAVGMQMMPMLRGGPGGPMPMPGPQ